MLTHASQHGRVPLLPDIGNAPTAKAPPATQAAAVPTGLEKVFAWNTCLQHEQDAVGRGCIAHCELARIALGEGTGSWDEDCSCRRSSLLTGRRSMMAEQA